MTTSISGRGQVLLRLMRDSAADTTKAAAVKAVMTDSMINGVSNKSCWILSRVAGIAWPDFHLARDRAWLISA